jgi:hypothetical protein
MIALFFVCLMDEGERIGENAWPAGCASHRVDGGDATMSVRELAAAVIGAPYRAQPMKKN